MIKSISQFALTLTVLAGSTLGQQLSAPQPESNLKGQVRSVAIDRIYVRMNGRNIGERRESLTLTGYDESGRVIEEFIYGKGFSRTRYQYSAARPTADIAYFDEAGNHLGDPSKFKPSFDSVTEAGLCAGYTIREDVDAAANVTRIYEICPDGSARATTVDEFNPRGDYIRSSRTDALSRSRISVSEYDREGNLIEYRTTIANGSKSYTSTVIYADHKFDDRGNWVRSTATSFETTYPGVLLFQFNEIRKITYYDQPKVKP